MDFNVQDCPEIAAFRQEIAAWLDRHTPPEVRLPLEQAVASPAVWGWAPGFQRGLAAQGWAAPSWPAAYGGGGLTPAHDQAVQDELLRRSVPDLYESSRHAASGVFTGGSETQRRGFLPPLLRGEAVAWRSPADADLAVDPDLATVRAERDGDVYLVSGAALFEGGVFAARFLWTLAVTDPQAPPERRLSAFLIPANLDGIAIAAADTIAVTPQHTVTLAEVAVPVEFRIGAEGDGGRIARQTQQPDADAGRMLARQQVVVARLVDYVRETFKGHVPAPRYRKLREQVAGAYVKMKELQAISQRNRWLREEGRPASYQRSQYALLARAGQEGLTATLLDTLGPMALVSDPERAPLGGEAEALQRSDFSAGAAVLLHEHLLAESLGLPSGPAGRRPDPDDGEAPD